MGLDMYLSARKYVSQYDYSDGENKTTENFSTLASMSGVNDLTKYSSYSGIEVSYPIAYWRKANAIHGWFVNECAGGVDECQPIHVSREHLIELRDLCKSAVSQPAMAGDILPPTAGFFFGSYEIDEYYMEDIKRTMEMLDHILSIIPDNSWDWSFVYQASW
jgi:hypothetical protein